MASKRKKQAKKKSARKKAARKVLKRKAASRRQVARRKKQPTEEVLKAHRLGVEYMEYRLGELDKLMPDGIPTGEDLRVTVMKSAPLVDSPSDVIVVAHRLEHLMGFVIASPEFTATEWRAPVVQAYLPSFELDFLGTVRAMEIACEQAGIDSSPLTRWKADWLRLRRASRTTQSGLTKFAKTLTHERLSEVHAPTINRLLRIVEGLQWVRPRGDAWGSRAPRAFSADQWDSPPMIPLEENTDRLLVLLALVGANSEVLRIPCTFVKDATNLSSRAVDVARDKLRDAELVITRRRSGTFLTGQGVHRAAVLGKRHGIVDYQTGCEVAGVRNQRFVDAAREQLDMRRDRPDPA